MPASNGHKKLTPRKFGMFGLSATTAEPQAPNSAGEALDDILGADALKVNEGDNEPLEPEKEANETIRGDTPIIQPGGEMSSFPANPYRVDNLVEGAELEIDEGIDENAQNGDLQSASEGDIEDNMSDREENSNGPPRRSLRTSQDRAGAKKSRATTKKTPARVKSNYGLRRTALRNSVASSSGAGKLRRSTRQAQTGGRAERTSTNKAKQIAASNKAKMTARAAAKRWKAGRVDREEYFAAVYGRKSKANRASRPQTGSVSAKEDERAAYFKAVYGRKRRKVKAEEESGQDQGEESEEDGLEAVGVISEAEAKVLESVGGLVEVDGGEVDAEG